MEYGRRMGNFSDPAARAECPKWGVAAMLRRGCSTRAGPGTPGYIALSFGACSTARRMRKRRRVSASELSGASQSVKVP